MTKNNVEKMDEVTKESVKKTLSSMESHATSRQPKRGDSRKATCSDANLICS